MKRVAAGIIVCNNKILIAQRKRGKDLEYFWEFPGGKIEPGETCEECLHREIMEEFNLEIRVGKFFMENSSNTSRPAGLTWKISPNITFLRLTSPLLKNCLSLMI